jgi:beta-lactamase regulating signal transducer with metallopeptidase domain
MNFALPTTFGLDLLPGSFAWTIAWQSTVILALGLVLAWLLRGQAAKAHLALILASTAAVVSPLLTGTVRQLDLGLLTARPVAEMDRADRAGVAPASPAIERSDLTPIDRVAQPAEVMANPTISPAFEARAVSRAENLPAEVPRIWTSRLRELFPAALAVCWIITSLTLAVRLAVSLLRGRRTAREAGDEANEELRAALRAAADALAVRRVPHLRVSPSTRCPMIWCWGAPALLLPESAAETRGVDWRSVFCHELAHLRRRDHWSALWAEVLVIALPWQPLAWRSRRRLAFLREQACDDWVLAAGGEAVDYAESLLQLVPQGASAYALAAVTNAEALKQRLKHVLAGLRIAPQAGRRWIAVAGCSALAGIAAVALVQQRTAVAAPKGVTNETVNSQPAAQGANAGNRPRHDAKESMTQRITVRGQVFAPDGKPAADAEVLVFYHRFVFHHREASESRLRLAATRTDAIGRYELSFQKPHVAADIALYGNPEIWASMTCVIARQAGYGPDAARLSEIDATKPVNLKLVPDVPIQGRLVDLEGRSVSGATVELQSISGRSSDELRKFLKTVRAGLYAAGVLTKTIPSDDRPPVTTDADGRFRIAGVGKDRVLSLVFRGETIAYSAVTVVTKDIQPMEQRVDPDLTLAERRRVVGPTFTFTAQPTRVIAGVVRDARDRKPLAGVRITSDQFPGTILSGVRTLSTTTDNAGRFRLLGMPKGPGAAIAVFPDGQPYFPRRIKVPDKAGGEPISLDVALHRGIWITGRVTDKLDGSPQTARIAYFPLRTNPYAKQLSEFVDQELPDGPGNDTDDASGEDGTYRIVGVPGAALISAWCTSGDYRVGVGFDELKTVKPDKNGHLMSAVFSNGSPAPSRKWPNVIKEVTFPAEPKPAACDLTLDPGEAVTISVLDASGKPVTNYDVTGRSPTQRFTPPLQESQFRVVGLAPGEKRVVLIHHAGRHIGKALTIDFGPHTPRTMTVALEACATLIGRSVDRKGVPVGGARVEPWVWPMGDYASQLPNATSGADGRFRHVGVLPGVDYLVNLRLGWESTTARERLSVKPGEMIDLGDVTVKRPD